MTLDPIEKIYSRIDPTKLLHQVVRTSLLQNKRIDLCPEDRFLQCAFLKLPSGTTFKAHKHIEKPATFIMPEESWIIKSGSVDLFMYDIDDKWFATYTLYEGDISFSFNGAGHNYEVNEAAEILEYKVGPYLGQEADKIFI